MVTQAASQPRIHPRFVAVVKGDPKTGKLLDCPFSHFVLLALEEKKVPYTKAPIDEQNMPEWIEKVNPNGAQIPIALDLEHNKWIADSPVIVKFIDQEYSDQGTKLGDPEKCCKVGENAFPAFKTWLTSKDESAAKEQHDKLISELNAIEQHLNSSGLYFGGREPCSACFMQAPRLYHIKEASPALKGWEVSKSEYPAIHKFLNLMAERPSWKATYYEPSAVVAGWKLKMEKSGAKIVQKVAA